MSRKKTESLLENSGNLSTVSAAPRESQRTLERAIGAQIRHFRRQRDLSVGDLASGAQVSVSMISKIENGQISPSLTSLQAIANALSVSISSLFTSAEENRDCSIVESGGGVKIERRGSKLGHVYTLLGHIPHGKLVVEPYLITLNEESAPYTRFRHETLELIYMLEGEIIYHHAGSTYKLAPGDTMLFDSRALHGPEELLSPTIRYLSIIIYNRDA